MKMGRHVVAELENPAKLNMVEEAEISMLEKRKIMGNLSDFNFLKLA